MNFEELYCQNTKQLYFIALNILRNVADAEDALQETAYKAMKKFNKLKNIELFSTWITRILINNCYQILRKNKKISKQVEFHKITSIWYDEINENECIVMQALSCLNEKERAIILLRYTYDLKLSDIAKIIGKSLNTVKSIHCRSLYKIKNQIEPEELVKY